MKQIHVKCSETFGIKTCPGATPFLRERAVGDGGEAGASRSTAAKGCNKSFVHPCSSLAMLQTDTSPTFSVFSNSHDGCPSL